MLGKSPAVLLMVTKSAWKEAQWQLVWLPHCFCIFTFLITHSRRKTQKIVYTAPLNLWSEDSLSSLFLGSKYSNINRKLHWKLDEMLHCCYCQAWISQVCSAADRRANSQSADFRYLEISGITQTKVYDKSLSCLRKRLVDQQILSGRWMELEQFYKWGKIIWRVFVI